MNRGDVHVIIIGAGIGGLTASLALQRVEFRVSVFEQAPELGEVGAGLTLYKNANIAFDFLGLNESIANLSDVPDIGAMKDYKTGDVLNTTAPLRSTPKGVNGGQWKKTEFDLRQVHRADLNELLVREVRANDPDAIHLGHNFQTATQDTNSITASFDNGSKASGQALIGCDGIVRLKYASPQKSEACKCQAASWLHSARAAARLSLKNLRVTR